MKLVKFLIGLVLLLVVALILVGVFADSIAKKAIEAGGTYALGVDTKVSGVDIGFLKSNFALDGLSVANPEGHGGGNFLELGGGSLDVSASSLTSDKIEVPEILLTGFRVKLVQGTKGSNYGKILDNLKRFQSTDGGGAGEPPAGGGEAAKEEDPSEGKRFVIHKLTMQDLLVTVVPVPEMRLAEVKIPIDKIELKDIGTDSDKGVLLSDLAGIIVEAILKRTSASGALPAMIKGALDGQLGQLTGLADAGIDQVEGLLQDTTRQGVENATGAAKDELEKRLRGLGIGR